MIPPAELAMWIISHAREDIERGRPLPPWLTTYVRHLLDPPTRSDSGPRKHEPATLEVGTDDAARILGCTPRHVRRLCQTGRLIARRTGRRAWLIRLERHDEATGDPG